MARSERFEGNEVASQERWGSSEATRWEVPGFIQEWGMQDESKIPFFSSDINQRNEGAGCFQECFEDCMDGKTLFRF